MIDDVTSEQYIRRDLKRKIVNLMCDFSEEYAAPNSGVYPGVGHVLVDVLTECLSEAQYQTADYAPFTRKQADHICWQIGDWYLMMKPLLEGQHNLGYMKEKLKIMICGDESEGR